MANELVYIDPTGTTGLTVTAEVFAATGAAAGTGISCIDGNSIGRYVGDMPAAAAGTYYVRFTSSDSKEGGGIIHWDGSAEITLNIIDTVVDSVLEDTDDLQTTKGERVTADVSGLATAASISALNNISVSDVGTAITNSEPIAANVTQVGDVSVSSPSDLTDEMTASELHAALDSYSGTLDANVTQVTGLTINGTGTKEDPWGP